MQLKNLAMQEALEKGHCLDVNTVGFPHEGFEGSVWELKEFKEGYDYCDAVGERWIWSIGKSRINGRYFAAADAQMYQNPYFECVWLR